MPLYDIFFFGALFSLLGVLFASLNFGFWIIVIVSGLSVIFLGVGYFRKQKQFFWVSGLVIFIILGALYYVSDDLKFRKESKIIFDKNLEFSGIIVENPKIKNNFQEFVFELTLPYHGRVLVNAEKYPNFEYGDELEIKGLIKKPFNEGYARYLEKERVLGVISFSEIKLVEKGRGSLIKKAIFGFKNRIVQSFKKVLGAKEAAFLSGLTLGGTSELSKEFKEAMSKSGTTHLVALSGYNISIIVWAVMGALLYFFSRRISFALSMFVVVAFVLMTGAEASVVRAAIMAFLVLLAREVGRIYDFRNAVIFVGLIMVLQNPKILVFDVGFQLSFMALLGIIYLRPVIINFFKWEESGFLSWKDNLVTTASAQLMVAPLLIANFNNFSLTSLIANVLVLELIPITMALGFSIAGLSFVSYNLSLVFAWFAVPLLKFEIFAIELFSRIDVLIAISLGISGALVYYAAIIIFIIYGRRFNFTVRQVQK